MSITTQTERQSVIDVGMPFAWRLLPVADGLIARVDRSHIAGFCSAIFGTPLFTVNNATNMLLPVNCVMEILRRDAPASTKPLNRGLFKSIFNE